MIPFCKFHGFGNDYIVIESALLPQNISLPDLARAMCSRNTGVGSDGIAVLTKLDNQDADHFCEIVNPDGSYAGFSGNGTRCAVSYLYYKGLWEEPSLTLKTQSGRKSFTLIERVEPAAFWFEAEIGKPLFAPADIPFRSISHAASVIDHAVIANNAEYIVSAVNVGNPVACIFVPNFDLDWRTAGKHLETAEVFPEKANIVFVRVIDNENIEIRIWERAAGETSSSGTCSSGAAVLSAFTRRTGRTVSVIAPGGTTEVHWRDDDEILLTGKAELAFCGEYRYSPPGL